MVTTLQTLDSPTLQNVSFTVKTGQLLAVIGPVGAGKVCPNYFSLWFHNICEYKMAIMHMVLIAMLLSIQSSLLSTVLGELPAEKGVIKTKGELTYASQQPWVFPGTIRSNILFGKELEPKRYEKVLRACALKRVRHLFL